MAKLFRYILALGAGWLFITNTTRTFLQVIFFLVLARSIGPSELGRLSAAMAIVGFFAPFGIWGGGNLLVRDVVHQPDGIRGFLGRALWVLIMASAVLSIAVAVLLKLILGFPFFLGLTLALAEISFAKLVDLVTPCFQALGQMRWMGFVNIQYSLIKLMAVIVFTLGPWFPSAWNWVFFYAGSSILGSILPWFWLIRQVGLPQFNEVPSKRTWVDGFHFSMASLCQSSFNDIDKPFVAHFAGLEAAGQYAVAYRVMGASLLPLSALLGSTYRHFFRAGRHGVIGGVAYLRRIRYLPLLGGGAGVLLCIIGAWLIPSLFGEKYRLASPFLFAMAPIMLFKALSTYMGDVLTGASLQHQRTWLQGGTAVFNLILCIVWIPRWGVWGAVAGSLASDFFLVLGVAFLVFRKLPRKRCFL